MKVSHITVVITATDGDEETVTAAYKSDERKWTVNGAAYPRHLAMLSRIVAAVREADSAREEK